MERRRTDYAWVVVFAALVTFAIPWFLWGTATTVVGLPVWLWWHAGWMVLASVLFYAFTRGAWDRGMGVDPDAEAGATPAEGGGGPEVSDG